MQLLLQLVCTPKGHPVSRNHLSPLLPGLLCCLQAYPYCPMKGTVPVYVPVDTAGWPLSWTSISRTMYHSSRADPGSCCPQVK